MSVDVFGRHLKKKDQSLRGPPGIVFNLTASGNFDIRSTKLCNVADPTNENHAVNLKFQECIKKFLGKKNMFLRYFDFYEP